MSALHRIVVDQPYDDDELTYRFAFNWRIWREKKAYFSPNASKDDIRHLGQCAIPDIVLALLELEGVDCIELYAHHFLVEIGVAFDQEQVVQSIAKTISDSIGRLVEFDWTRTYVQPPAEEDPIWSAIGSSQAYQA